MNESARAPFPPAEAALLWVALALTWLALTPGVSGPLILDDHVNLSASMALDVGQWERWAEVVGRALSGPLGRPVATISFFMDGVTHGAAVDEWKRNSVLFHLLAGVLLFGFMRSLVRGLRGGDSASWLPLLVTAVWLLHPLQVSTVLYLVQRMAVLSALFVFLALWLYSSGRVCQMEGQPGGWWRIASAILIATPLAALSKENGALAPLMMLLMEMVVFRFAGGHRIRRGLMAMFFVCVIAPGVAAVAYMAANFDAVVMGGYAARGFSLSERLITESRVLVKYLVMLAVPSQRNYGFFHDDIEVSEGILTPVTGLMSMFFVVALIWLAYRLRRVRPLVAFGIALFFVGHVLESTIIPLELMFEHRNYLPSAGLILAGAGIIEGRIAASRGVAAAVFVLVGSLALLTSFRAELWAGERFFARAYDLHPKSPALVSMLAERVAKTGRSDQAVEMLRAVPGDGSRLQRLYIACLATGRVRERELESIAAQWRYAGMYEVSGLIELSNAALDRRCAISIPALLELLEAAYRNPVARMHARQKIAMYRAHLLKEMGDLDAAVAALDSGFDDFPRNVTPLLMAAEWLIEGGEVRAGADRYYRALSEMDDPAIYRFHVKRIGGMLRERRPEAAAG